MTLIYFCKYLILKIEPDLHTCQILDQTQSKQTESNLISDKVCPKGMDTNNGPDPLSTTLSNQIQDDSRITDRKDNLISKNENEQRFAGSIKSQALDSAAAVADYPPSNKTYTLNLLDIHLIEQFDMIIQPTSARFSNNRPAGSVLKAKSSLKGLEHHSQPSETADKSTTSIQVWIASAKSHINCCNIHAHLIY